MDGARNYAENAICKRTERMNYLRLASRLDLWPLFLSPSSLLSYIGALIWRCWNCSLHHVSRELDLCADFLAKEGVTFAADMITWQFPPAGMHELVPGDPTGVGKYVLSFSVFISSCTRRKQKRCFPEKERRRVLVVAN